MEGEPGIFCEIYGASIRNRMLEFMLVLRRLDFAVIDLADEVGISKPKAYEEVKKFEKQRLIIKSRVIGGTQLYKLDLKHRRVKLLLKTFKDCLKLVAEEYMEEHPEECRKSKAKSKSKSRSHSYSSASIGSVSAKGF